jgi:hypothetical protein
MDESGPLPFNQARLSDLVSLRFSFLSLSLFGFVWCFTRNVTVSLSPLTEDASIKAEKKQKQEAEEAVAVLGAPSQEEERKEESSYFSRQAGGEHHPIHRYGGLGLYDLHQNGEPFVCGCPLQS